MYECKKEYKKYVRMKKGVIHVEDAVEDGNLER